MVFPIVFRVQIPVYHNLELFMSKRLTNKERYVDGFLHTAQFNFPETKLFPLKNDILFKNFDVEYNNKILNHENLNKILQILANNDYNRVEITFQISYWNSQTNDTTPLGQIRRYPTIDELQNYENYLLNSTLNKHIVHFTFKDGFIKDPSFDYNDYLGKQICISTIWLQIEHTNPALYKLL